MSTQSIIRKGVVHGNTIELVDAPGLPDGQEVTVVLQPVTATRSEWTGAGILHSAGAWADGAEELDEYLKWSRQQRKKDRAQLEP